MSPTGRRGRAGGRDASATWSLLFARSGADRGRPGERLLGRAEPRARVPRAERGVETAERRGREPDRAPEDPREMRLIVEAGVAGDLGERTIGLEQGTARRLQAEAAEVGA